MCRFESGDLPWTLTPLSGLCIRGAEWTSPSTFICCIYLFLMFPRYQEGVFVMEDGRKVMLWMFDADVSSIKHSAKSVTRKRCAYNRTKSKSTNCAGMTALGRKNSEPLLSAFLLRGKAFLSQETP